MLVMWAVARGHQVAEDAKRREAKSDLLPVSAYRSRKQARSDVFDYIERFYNPTRRHSTLGYISPIKFEEAREA